MNGDGTYTPGVDRTFQLDAGVSGDMPVVGDWDGSGVTRVGVFRKYSPSPGVVSGWNFFWVLDRNNPASSVHNTAANQIYAFAFGGAQGDLPVVGDWDGTGITKVGVFRGNPAMGWANFLWVLDANNPSSATHGLGQVFEYGGVAYDMPVTGRW